MDARTDNAALEVGAAETQEKAPPSGRFTLSPLNQRRWRNFKNHKRGYWSLWLFLALFLASLFAEFIANDRPFYVHVNGH